jgi:uncharacterized protein
MLRPRYQVLAAVVVIALLVGGLAPRLPRPIRTPSAGDSFPPIPSPVGFVNDFANVIQPACRERIDGIATEVREKSKGEIAVVTLRSLESRRIEEWGLRIGRSWRVGFAGAKDDPRTNTGVIVLVAPTERRSRIELGYGAEAFISDSLAGRIVDEQMLPSFRQGDIGRGVLRSVNAVAHEFARRFDFALESAAGECGARLRRVTAVRGPTPQWRDDSMAALVSGPWRKCRFS